MELFSVAGLSEFGMAGGFLFHLLADFESEGWLIYCPSAGEFSVGWRILSLEC